MRFYDKVIECKLEHNSSFEDAIGRALTEEAQNIVETPLTPDGIRQSSARILAIIEGLQTMYEAYTSDEMRSIMSRVDLDGLLKLKGKLEEAGANSVSE